MRSYYTVDRIHETWARAEAAGINTFITNNETSHVVEAVRSYLSRGGALQWIAQVNCRHKPMLEALDEVVAMGCRALYIHGAQVDNAYRNNDQQGLRSWCDHARSLGVPVGVAGHAPEAHLWAAGLDVADFHAVSLFNCGSLHDGKGDRFRLADMAPALDGIRRIAKPCIAYKIMGAGRMDARMAFEYTFGGIKASDAVNVGMFRGDNDRMIEENVDLVSEILGSAPRDV
jgi:hypothetical protein